MKIHEVTPNMGYVVTAVSVPLTVTALMDDGSRVELLTMSRVGQAGFASVSSRVEFDQDDVILIESSFSVALSGNGESGGGSADFGSDYVKFNDEGDVESFALTHLSNFDYLFYNKAFVEDAVSLSSSVAVSAVSAFAFSDVKNVVASLPNATDVSFLFDRSEVETVTLKDVSQALNMQTMFQNTASLRSITFLDCDFSKVQSISSMFIKAGSPDSGTTITGDLVFDSATNVASAFNSSYVCGKVVLVIPATKTMASMFNNSKLMEELDLTTSYDLMGSIYQLAYGCSALRRFTWRLPDTGNFANSASFSAICQGCSSLEFFELKGKFPPSLLSCFKGCSSLEFVNGDVSGVHNLTSCFEGCTQLADLPLAWPALSSANGAFSGCALTGLQINTILASLPVFSSGSHVISFVGCPGAADCDPAIGTAKGWTVQV